MERTFETPQPPTLQLDLNSGSVSVTASATAETTVRVEGPQAESFRIEYDGHRVLVSPPRIGFRPLAHDGGHYVQVSAPTGSDLAVRLASADVNATGEYGAVTIKSGSGDVTVEKATGDVVLASGSGALRVGNVAGDLRAKTGSGDVNAGDVDGEVRVTTGSGAVALGTVTGATHVKSGSGDVEVDSIDADLDFLTGSGDLRIGRAAKGNVAAKSGSGNLAVGVAAGTPVWTDVSTKTGVVLSSLENLGAPEAGQAHVELRLHTGSGNIHLRHV